MTIAYERSRNFAYLRHFALNLGRSVMIISLSLRIYVDSIHTSESLGRHDRLCLYRKSP